MKWCRFNKNGEDNFGIIENEKVVKIIGDPFSEFKKTSEEYNLDDVKLLPPVIPPTFYAAGINYPEHVTWAAQMRGEEPVLPARADIGYRAVNALTGQGDPINVPSDATEQLQYEGELVVVIGKICRNVTEKEALDYVFGYTIGNDVSERTWQRNDRTMWRAKNSDSFKPMGPWIVTDLEPDDFHVIVRVNDKIVGEYDVKTAIFSVRHYISEMSKYLTLYPGDIIWMGTDGATENMKDKDVVEVEINDIGILRNTVHWGK
ncbi:MAG TPA: 2-keto-4-pentenoate hydratase [Dehalococcoidia bacterium]|jgi:2-keto-4-pentenoate hydratase/2-oxohepta-3-ene-1,7-dioic acid hydratase in catechol pathway|nr:2-keto-4-pentenoate hydratase [Dehalococcoidia bacterium]|tara:strand:- start:2097 stop:2879 length:783 start_codon:yes stop_codon:yes gene_type:complete